MIGVLIGLPTLRLRGDYLAIVTLGFGEIMPQIARNGNDLFNTGFNLTGGPQGITPIDSPGFGNKLDHATRRLPAGELPDHGERERLLLGRAAAPRVHDLLLAAPARLAPRPRVDRDPRGRDRRLGDGHPADADEDVVVRDGRVLRRPRRGVLRVVQELDLPAGLLLQHLGLHPLHGHPRRHGERLGRAARRRLPRVPERGGPRQHRRLAEREPRDAHRRARVPDRDLRRADRRRHAAPPAGPAPERAAEARARVRHHDEYLYDVESHDSPVYVENPEPA